MHGPPLTIDEIAAKLDRQVIDVRALGASFDRAVRVVAERHQLPLATVTQLLMRHRRLEKTRALVSETAA
jgi:hypothetical protein